MIDEKAVALFVEWAGYASSAFDAVEPLDEEFDEPLELWTAINIQYPVGQRRPRIGRYRTAQTRRQIIDISFGNISELQDTIKGWRDGASLAHIFAMDQFDWTLGNRHASGNNR